MIKNKNFRWKKVENFMYENIFRGEVFCAFMWSEKRAGRELARGGLNKYTNALIHLHCF